MDIKFICCSSFCCNNKQKCSTDKKLKNVFTKLYNRDIIKVIVIIKINIDIFKNNILWEYLFKILTMAVYKHIHKKELIWLIIKN